MSGLSRRVGRRRTLTFGLPVLAAAVIAGTLVVTSRGGGGAGAPADDPVVATVGSRQLHASALAGRVAVAVTAAQQGGAPASGSPRYPAFVAALRARALKSLITDAVIAQEAQARGVAAADADVDREVAADTSNAGGEAQLATQLAEAGSTLAQLRDGTRARLNEAQLEDYFARQRAADVLAQLTQGRTFADLAPVYSDDDQSRGKGGDLGALALDQLKGGDTAFAAAVAALPPGQTTPQPVRDAAGYEILHIDAATATTRTVHRILVAAPQPYTEKERPDWFTQSVLQALADSCAAGRITILISSAGQVCGLDTSRPSPAAVSPGAAPPGAASGAASPSPGG